MYVVFNLFKTYRNIYIPDYAIGMNNKGATTVAPLKHYT